MYGFVLYRVIVSFLGIFGNLGWFLLVLEIRDSPYFSISLKLPRNFHQFKSLLYEAIWITNLSLFIEMTSEENRATINSLKIKNRSKLIIFFNYETLIIIFKLDLGIWANLWICSIFGEIQFYTYILKLL